MRAAPNGSSKPHIALIAGLMAVVLAAWVSVPQYDQTTDSAISSLQKEVDAQLVQWISDEKDNTDASKNDASYARNIKFYDKVDTDLTSLELRMEAVPDPLTSRLTTFFTSLRQQLADVRDLHQKKGNLSATFLTPTRAQHREE